MLQSRALGLWETFKAITHDACYGFETMSIITQFTGPIDRCLFTKSIEFAYQRHPLLQATIQERDNVYYYLFNTSFTDIPIDYQKGITASTLEDSLQEASNSSVEPQKYLWKVKVFYSDNSAIFSIVMHHSPCDGRSMMTVVDDILYSYSCLLNNEIPDRPTLPLLPATEYLTEKNSKREDYLQQRAEIIAATTQENAILSLGPQEHYVPFDQRQTHIMYNELNEQQTADILNFCAKNQFKSNSLLNGLMLITAQRVRGHPVSLAMLTPVQAKTSIDKDQVGCHVCLVTTLYENISSDTNLLELSHEFQRKLKEGIREQANLPKDLTKNDICIAYGLNLNLDFYNYQLVVSNLGEATIHKDYKPCTVEQIKIGVNNRAGAVACVLITYILHGKMQLAFVFNKPLVSENYIEHFSKEFLQLIHELC